MSLWVKCFGKSRHPIRNWDSWMYLGICFQFGLFLIGALVSRRRFTATTTTTTMRWWTLDGLFNEKWKNRPNVVISSLLRLVINSLAHSVHICSFFCFLLLLRRFSLFLLGQFVHNLADTSFHLFIGFFFFSLLSSVWFIHRLCIVNTNEFCEIQKLLFNWFSANRYTLKNNCCVHHALTSFSTE